LTARLDLTARRRRVVILDACLAQVDNRPKLRQNSDPYHGTPG
jgi:hypothetical protein